jgi:hypothetical protein
MTTHPGARFDTDYLDLRDGETRTIGVTGLRPGAALRATTYRKG